MSERHSGARRHLHFEHGIDAMLEERAWRCTDDQVVLQPAKPSSRAGRDCSGFHLSCFVDEQCSMTSCICQSRLRRLTASQGVMLKQLCFDL